MRDNLRMAGNMARGHIPGRMEPCMLVNTKTASGMAGVYIFSLMEQNMVVNG